MAGLVSALMVAAVFWYLTSEIRFYTELDFISNRLRELAEIEDDFQL